MKRIIERPPCSLNIKELLLTCKLMLIRTVLMLFILMGVVSCGTARGVWDGASSVINGVYEDVKDISDMLL